MFQDKLNPESQEAQEIAQDQLEQITGGNTLDQIKEMERKIKSLEKENKNLKKHTKRKGKEVKKSNKKVKTFLKERKENSRLKVKEKKLKEKSKGIIGRTWEKIKNGIKYVVGKVKDGAKWLWEKITAHPILMIVILLVAAAVYYYSGPLSVGVSGMPEMANNMVVDTAAKTMDFGANVSLLDTPELGAAL